MAELASATSKEEFEKTLLKVASISGSGQSSSETESSSPLIDVEDIY